MKKILFICIGNSCRSQMAEAIARAYDYKYWQVFSAGIAPEPIRKETILTLQQFPHTDTTLLFPKSVEIFQKDIFDIVVTLCDYVRDTISSLPQTLYHIHRHIDDPAAAEEDKEKVYMLAAKNIENVIKELYLFLHEVNNDSHNHSNVGITE